MIRRTQNVELILQRTWILLIAKYWEEGLKVLVSGLTRSLINRCLHDSEVEEKCTFFNFNLMIKLKFGEKKNYQSPRCSTEISLENPKFRCIFMQKYHV